MITIPRQQDRYREELGMWTKPALARALRQQSLAHRRRNFTFTPAPLPRELEMKAVEPAPAAKPEPQRTIRSQVVLSD
jgi:hypothetical protein